MPLHLLSKKSWNVYNPQAIAKVRADEAAAAAADEAHDERLREYDAAHRLATLRGTTPPEAPSAPRQEAPKREDRESKKRRRLPGEDDTDRDIRFAQEDADNRPRHRSKRDQIDAALTDHAGHIQLFAPPTTSKIRENNAEAEKERKQKERISEAQYTLKFDNAAGARANVKDMPWYAKTSLEQDGSSHDERHGYMDTGKNAFGNDDPNRGRRDAVRTSAADPMAAMAKAQRILKTNERRRELENEERMRELDREDERDRHRRHKRRRRHRRET